MSKYLISMILLVFLAAPAIAQEEETTAEPVAEPQEAAEADTAEELADIAAIIGDEDLDEQTYEEDEDDFVPTEEIPADEPIPFPSNI